MGRRSEHFSDTETSGRRESRRGSWLATAPKSLALETERRHGRARRPEAYPSVVRWWLCQTAWAERPSIHVHTDHNADEIRSFYEIPGSLARVIQPIGDERTFTQCLADLLREVRR